MDDRGPGLTEYKRNKLLKFFTGRWASEGYNIHNVEVLVSHKTRRKMSAVCQGFVQNAWKKDFCSNCFKSKDEHSEKATQKNSYFSTTLQNRNISNLIKSSPQGILKATSKNKNRRIVSFSKDVCQVIGYGGEIWSDEEDFELNEDIEEDDYIPDCEEEKQLKILTKTNTDFNSVKANLLGGEVKKSYTSLLLGKMQTDSEGRKKTLHVSVTPFGHENSVKNCFSKNSDKKSLPLSSIHKNKENISDYKGNIVLTSFVKNSENVNNVIKRETNENGVLSEKSLLEEISETLEKNRISHVNKSDDHIKNNAENYNSVKSEEKVLQFQNSSDKTIEMFESKKNSINLSSPIKKDLDKPKINIISKPEFTFCKIDIEPVRCSLNNELDHEVITNDYSIGIISKSLSSDDDSFSSKSDSDFDERDCMKTRNNSKNSEESVKIKVFSGDKGIDLDDKGSSDVSLEDIRKVDGQSDSFQDIYENQFDPKICDIKFINQTNSAGMFSVEASRELAGEPDGRADPEDLSEPPALPKSPPPQMDPRPSFLHGMIKENLCRPIIPEKPKLPVKPLSVIKQISKRPQANVIPQQQTHLQIQTSYDSNKKKNGLESIIKDEIIIEKNNSLCDTGRVIYTSDENSDNDVKLILEKQDSNGFILTPNKRKAPKPPASTQTEESVGTLYQRNPSANIKSDSPVVREKEKRERASSCSPKFRQDVNSNPCGGSIQNIDITPEPTPRRSLSLSHDNLIGVDEKKKGKLKFSLRKLLRIGSSKELDKKDINVEFDSKTISKKEEVCELTPKPKPRLVIIHPLELNGSTVEVLKNNMDVLNVIKQNHIDDISISDGSTYSCNSTFDGDDAMNKDNNKPPPPPRKISDDGISPIDGCPMKPARPPPPKSAILLRQQKQALWNVPPTHSTNNVYANLGEVRSSIAPRKPERTASMREREAQLEFPKKRINSPENKNNDSNKIEIIERQNETINSYDDVYGCDKYEMSTKDRNNCDGDYEFVSNCTSIPQRPIDYKNFYLNQNSHEKYSSKTNINSNYKKNDTIIDKTENYIKATDQFMRSSSVSYCGSETESDAYSPYSFYSCSEVNNNENPGDFNTSRTISNTTNKLRIRKGRSVVHKNLEDNYGAVVIANHEALAQVLEQVQQSIMMQPSLRGLKTCTNLRWNDFTITSATPKGIGLLKVGKRVFHSAVWNSNSTNGAVNVTLMLHKEQIASQIVSQHIMQPQTLCLNAVTEFCDLVPLQQFGEESDQLVQATVVVLAHSQMDTIETFGEYLSSKLQNSPVNMTPKRNMDREFSYSNEVQHEAIFVLLQLINGLKCLQARGVEELPSLLSSFVICREEIPSLLKNQQTAPELDLDDGPPSIQMPKANYYGRLCIVQGLTDENSVIENTSSLCECAIIALKILLPNDKLTPLIQDLLKKEKAVSLNQVKSVLEFTLWGPWDVVFGLPIKERELSLQRWLDLERATVLHGLVRTRVHLNAFEQSHLMFLVHSTSKIMCDASVLLESSHIY